MVQVRLGIVDSIIHQQRRMIRVSIRQRQRIMPPPIIPHQCRDRLVYQICFRIGRIFIPYGALNPSTSQMAPTHTVSRGRLYCDDI